MVWIWLDRYRICEIILRTFLRRCAKRLSLSFNPQMGMVIWSFWAWKRLKTCNLKVRFTSSCKRPSEKQSWQISDIPPKMYWKRWKSLLEGSRVYKLEYLLVAQRDMVEIVRYISGKLQKPDAADCLVMELVNVAERVITFPYALPAYQPIRLLKREYWKILVQNFLMFYWVDEEKKLVTVARVMYAKRDIGRLLEWWKVEWLRRLRKLRITVECLNRLYVVGVGETVLRKEVSHLAKAPKVRYSICHTGSGFCNIERMGSVEISSSRALKKWYNE